MYTECSHNCIERVQNTPFIRMFPLSRKKCDGCPYNDYWRDLRLIPSELNKVMVEMARARRAFSSIILDDSKFIKESPE